MVAFYIRKDSKSGGYVIIRVGFPYDFHAHVKSKNGAHQILRLIAMGLEPKSDYLAAAVRRLLTEEEYAKLKKCKEKYVNNQRR